MKNSLNTHYVVKFSMASVSETVRRESRLRGEGFDVYWDVECLNLMLCWCFRTISFPLTVSLENGSTRVVERYSAFNVKPDHFGSVSRRNQRESPKARARNNAPLSGRKEQRRRTFPLVQPVTGTRSAPRCWKSTSKKLLWMICLAARGLYRCECADPQASWLRCEQLDQVVLS